MASPEKVESVEKTPTSEDASSKQIDQQEIQEDPEIAHFKKIVNAFRFYRCVYYLLSLISLLDHFLPPMWYCTNIIKLETIMHS